MGAMVSSVNVETETYLISFFISKFTELFSIEVNFKTSLRNFFFNFFNVDLFLAAQKNNQN